MWKILKFLPRNLISRMTGLIVHWQGPEWIVQPLIQGFSWLYKINLTEVEKPLTSYKSLGDFFVRKLKPGLRPLGTKDLVHCADSEILASGPILDGGQCVQAKGKTYLASEFLDDPQWFERFQSGYYINYYLCPTDYHRVHSPCEGFIQKIKYIPGDLWPVHPAALAEVDSLYPKNERVVMDLATPLGAVTVVLVGATNVGSIEISHLQGFKANRGGAAFVKDFSNGELEIKKGDELGAFRMGSTVVIYFSKEISKKYFKDYKAPRFVKVLSSI